MRSLLLLFALGLSLGLVALPAPLIQAQAGPEIVIIHTTTTPQADGLGLQVYFALRNPDGSPVLRNEVRLNQRGTIELLDSRELPAEAQIGAPQAPLKILLLMDASGSMRPLIEEVRVAAKKAVSAAPEGSLIAVAQFAQLGPADPLGLLQSFTPNRELVGQALDAIRPAERAPTCLYNAAFQAVETLKLNESGPLERQAILLFTDGKDDDGSGTACSSRAVENVISGANERGIPIYTIGLCDTADCANLDGTVLTTLASKTGGISTLGQRSDLEQLFQRAMEGLSSQWVAEAMVFPRQGGNRAVLSIQLASDGPTISQAFEFDSDADYTAPATVELVPIYDATNDRYRLEVRITNPATLEQATLELWGNEGLITERRFLPAELAAPLELPTEGLRSGQEYCFRLRATRRDGQPLTGARGEAYAAERCVTYNPSLSFAISSVDPDWENNKLLIGVDVRGGGAQPPLFVGQITAKSGQRVASIPRAAPNSTGNLIIDLPASFRRAAPESEYLLTLRLDGISEVIEEQRSFRITPPSTTNWSIIIVGLLAGIGLVLGLSFFIGRGRSASGNVAIPKVAEIYNKPTQEFGATGGAAERPRVPASAELVVRLTIIRTTAPDQQGLDMLISQRNSPLMIGRSDATQLTINDPEISNRHAQIAVVGHEVYLTDLGSKNGTFLNGQQLAKKARVVLTLPAQLGLGHDTVLRVEAKL